MSSKEKLDPAIAKAINDYKKHLGITMDILFKLMTDKKVEKKVSKEFLTRVAAVYVAYGQVMRLSALSDERHLLKAVNLMEQYVRTIPPAEMTEFDFRQSILELDKTKNLILDGGNC